MGGGAAGGLFEKTRVPLEEEDVEDQVKAEGAEVDECREEPPVLLDSELAEVIHHV